MAISGTCSACLGLITNVLHPKQWRKVLKINELPQRGAGVLERNEPKRGGATLKNFFLIKFTRSVCEDGGSPKRNRVVGVGWIRRKVIVSEITVPRCRSLLLVE